MYYFNYKGVCMKRVDLTGRQFGRLTVKESGGSVCGRPVWKCLCSCGSSLVVKAGNLRSGNTKSCGCYREDVITDHGLHDHPLYKVYDSIKSRCYNSKCTSFKNYGARGITVCDRWLSSFEAFYGDVQEGYSKGLELDRVDNNGQYSPTNTRWVTKQQNSFNRGAYQNKSSQYKGVSLDNRRGKWVASIMKDQMSIYLGAFSDETEAANAYNSAAIKLFGSFANINKIEV
jgi:hypothetical protein